jgi:hypothetical protein
MWVVYGLDHPDIVRSISPPLFLHHVAARLFVS